ncbi:MAG: hypothetical protein CMI35_12695 [Owenweeksia sp.]|nr:hypothetical protein [Owenweeksia sp.]
MQASEFYGSTENWASLPDSRIDDSIKKFFYEATGNSRFPNQWSRILGIDYDTVGSEFYELLQNSDDPKVSMHLALDGNNLFTILLKVEVEIENHLHTHFFKSGMEDDGRIFDISNTPIPSELTAIYGISTELRNQLAYNWLVSIAPTKDLFYSFAANDTDNKLIEGNYTLVRALYYPIRDNSLKALIRTVKEESSFKIRFGVNPSDFSVDKDLFTLIVEIGDPETGQTTYLDFVGACPPACSGDGNT